MDKKIYTKESIKARMFKHIAMLWDIRNVEMLDPVVKLLVEALASEIFKLSGDMEYAQDRIIERLANAFTPSYMMAASPAHAVIHARAADSSFDINMGMELAYKEPRFIQKHNLRKLSFTPIEKSTLINGDVVCLITQGKIFDVSHYGGKEHIASSLSRNPIFNRSVWVGLDIAKDVKSLKNTLFYFDFPLMDSCEEYLKLIGRCTWSIEGQNICVTPAPFGKNSDNNIFDLFDQRLQLCDDIAAKYNANFIALHDDIRVKTLKREPVPSELTGVFDLTAVKGVQNNLIWIKIVFPPAFDEKALEFLNVQINCFPAVNIFKRKSFSAITKFSSMLPITKNDNEYFLFMDSVLDSKYNEYKQALTHDDNTSSGTYTIRRGGSERFNVQDARTFLERLLDLFIEQPIAFSSISRNITESVETILNNLSDFDKNSGAKNAETTSYLILATDAEKVGANLTMNYFLTNGAIANKLRASEVLEAPELADIDPKAIFLMTATRGGAKSPPESSRKDIYQFMFTTRNRVYTKEDIKLFCRCYYGERFDNVRVENGYEVSNIPKEGIIRVTKVILEGVKKESDTETETLRRDVLSGLKLRSPDDINYKIIVV